MKKQPPALRKLRITFLLFFLTGTICADEYRWDLVNALIQNNFTAIENIIKANVNTMSAADKRLVTNFAVTYSYGDNTVRVFDILQRYNIHPDSFDLYTAINRNQPDNVIQFILRNGVRANGEILLLSMERQRFDFAREFIESGVDVNYQYPLTRDYADGMTALLYASKWGNFELVKLLLEHGANINARARDGNTAVSIARTNENAQIYNYLLENGANETGSALIPPSQGTGIASILENQAAVFQTGTYRLFGGSTELRFSGNGNSGSMSYFMNGRAISGYYTTEGGNITLIMEGRTFIYKIDSNISFSGNGEVWVRTGN
jgi:hypothetical protein